ncbi:hypothetical protein Tco_0993389 [Tanacetum coccineum]|uniref:F-box protein n=1 Tax=Tanacetum coccineum TaxID=301880 RepID=A0ABQ5F619_9ASTR
MPLMRLARLQGRARLFSKNDPLSAHINRQFQNHGSLSFDSPQFIVGYGARITQPPRFIVRKTVGIRVLSSGYFDLGFGVCPVNNDPTVLKISYNPWHVEVFTLSSGVWSLIPSSDLPRESIRLDSSTQIVILIDRFIYWVASDMILAADWPVTNMIISFDLITKKFKEGNEVNESVCVRIMVHDGVITSFTKLFTIDRRNLSVNKILGFRKSGEVIMENAMQIPKFAALEVYEPCSQDTEDLEIYGDADSFFMGSYKETLLLLDHSDGYIYSHN